MPGGGGRRASPPPAHARASQWPPRRKFRSLTDPGGSNSGRGRRGGQGAGILDADALRAGRRRGSVGAFAGAGSPGTASGGAGVRALLPAYRPAPLLRLPGWAGDIPPAWPTSEEPAPYFPPTEGKRFWNRSFGGTEANLPQLLGSRQAPFWGGRSRWSISPRCRNGRTHLASSLRCCLPDLRLGMRRRLVIIQ